MNTTTATPVGHLSMALFVCLFLFSCNSQNSTQGIESTETELKVLHDESAGTISVFREGEKDALVVQNALPDFRPYLHPIVAPDGKGNLTEYSPGHHKHQTGLYWGFTRVNGRDYFHHPEGDYWKRVSAKVLTDKGTKVKWQTVYDLLDEAGNAVLRETQTWEMEAKAGKFLLSLDWEGNAQTEVTIGEYDYGGLFLRMPWKEGINGEVVNAARQRNERAEGQRAMWVDVGMQVEGREDLAHIAIFDHPENHGFPQMWRVDGQLGVGPVRARMGDWTIEKGQTERIRHQIVAYIGKLNNVELTETWNQYIGSNSMYSTASLWGIAQAEGRAAKFLNPQEAVDNMTLKEGFKVNAWASEPMITQPMAFCWDDWGRMWIAENRDYESRGTGFSNSGDSRILIIEDTDNDGVADKKTVFLEGIPFPSAIAVGFGGLYLGAPPNLLFVPDKDGDDKGDKDDIEILLTGWGIRDRHETINSLHWGPDGWLYGLEGFATPSKIRKPATDARLLKHKEAFPEDILEGEGIDINGGVWRYHPTKDRFEVVAHGFSNPWGIDYDAKGQLFISACVIPHLFHVIPGGIYHRQGGQHFNPYVYADIQTIVDHRHRSAHGGARVYLSDAFPKEHQGRIFMANIHEHAVLSDELESKGSGFVAHHGEDFLMANNAQWIGFSMELGPEGALYVLDWHDADICGKDVVNKETGRIFRIRPKKSLAENWEGRYDDLATFTDEQLAKLQLSKSSWHARRARVILQYRASKGKISEKARAQLQDIFKNNQDADLRLRGMWALHVTDELSESNLLASLKDKDPHVRAWAIQFLCEDESPSGTAKNEFAKMASNDPSSVVRLYLAGALQRMPPASRWEIVKGLVSHSEDADDHNIPKMAWFGLESLVAVNPDRAIAIAGESKMPMITEFIGRRLVDADQLELLVNAIGNKKTGRKSLLHGMLKGLEGKADLVAPFNWKSVYNRLEKDKELGPIALEIAQRFGDTEAAKKYLATLQDDSAPLKNRKKAIVQLAGQQREELVGLLPELIENEKFRLEGIKAVSHFQDRKLGQLLLNKYENFNEKEKMAVIHSMSSRQPYGGMLTNALKENSISKRDVPAYLARQLRSVVGNGFVEVWGPIDQLSSDKQAEMEKYKAMLTADAIEAANPSNGRRLFHQSCGACHQLYGEGGNLGPDITGSNRADTDYILNQILNPSEEIQDDYKMVTITTRKGRTYMGNVAAEDDRQLTLRLAGQDPITVSKSAIQSRETASVSIMPEGLLQQLTNAEIVDLIAYLKTSEQVELP